MLQARGVSRSHPDKLRQHFTSPLKPVTDVNDDVFIATRNAVVVADGVGAVRGRLNIDGALLPKEIASRLVCTLSAFPEISLDEALETCTISSNSMGATTLVCATLKDDKLRTFNMGDTGWLHLKPDSDGLYHLVDESVTLEYAFNCPLQLSTLERERVMQNMNVPSFLPTHLAHLEGNASNVSDVEFEWRAGLGDALAHVEGEVEIEVQPGDLLLFYSDGLRDNLHDVQVEEAVNHAVRHVSPSQFSKQAEYVAALVRMTTAILMRSACKWACSGTSQRDRFTNDRLVPAGWPEAINWRTPWVDEFLLVGGSKGNDTLGGKPDDITLVASFVCPAEVNSQPAHRFLGAMSADQLILTTPEGEAQGQVNHAHLDVASPCSCQELCGDFHFELLCNEDVSILPPPVTRAEGKLVRTLTGGSAASLMNHDCRKPSTLLAQGAEVNCSLFRADSYVSASGDALFISNMNFAPHPALFVNVEALQRAVDQARVVIQHASNKKVKAVPMLIPPSPCLNLPLYETASHSLAFLPHLLTLLLDGQLKALAGSSGASSTLEAPTPGTMRKSGSLTNLFSVAELNRFTHADMQRAITVKQTLLFAVEHLVAAKLQLASLGHQVVHDRKVAKAVAAGTHKAPLDQLPTHLRFDHIFSQLAESSAVARHIAANIPPWNDFLLTTLIRNPVPGIPPPSELPLKTSVELEMQPSLPAVERMPLTASSSASGDETSGFRRFLRKLCCTEGEEAGKPAQTMLAASRPAPVQTASQRDVEPERLPEDAEDDAGKGASPQLSHNIIHAIDLVARQPVTPHGTSVRVNDQLHPDELPTSQSFAPSQNNNSPSMRSHSPSRSSSPTRFGTHLGGDADHHVESARQFSATNMGTPAGRTRRGSLMLLQQQMAGSEHLASPPVGGLSQRLIPVGGGGGDSHLSSPAGGHVHSLTGRRASISIGLQSSPRVPQQLEDSPPLGQSMRRYSVVSGEGDIVRLGA